MPSTQNRRRRGKPLARPWMAVMAGGLVGSCARLGVAELLGATTFPWAAVAVNLGGSFLLGLYLARRERAVESSIPFWAIGVFGSFTTFSVFSLDVVRLLDGGRPALAGGYVAASLIGGLAFALLGERVGSVIA
jgi:fluoride exporter